MFKKYFIFCNNILKIVRNIFFKKETSNGIIWNYGFEKRSYVKERNMFKMKYFFKSENMLRNVTKRF